MDSLTTLSKDYGMAATSFSTQEAEVYQSVSRAAVASLVLGIFGVLSIWLLPLLLLPILGIAFALVAFSSFRRYPGEVLGRPIALVGTILSGVTLVAAPAYHSYVYVTEVPEGYLRVDFGSLKGTKDKDVPTREAVELNGEKVFIKGYIHPSSMDSVMAKKFVLVPDLGTCCFGGQPPLTHMIEVNLEGDQYARKSYRKQRLAGTLRVNPSLKPIEELTGVFYQLRADILK
jgi:hypothetical protein